MSNLKEEQHSATADLVAPATVAPDAPICFLHAGGIKTGSTALQRFLAQNKEDFRAHGFLLPRTGANGATHHKLIRDISDLPPEAGFEKRLSQLREELSNNRYDHMIVSCETVGRRVAREPGGIRIVPFFQALGFKVVFIYYVRNMTQFINSNYTQRVKAWGFTEPFDTYVDTVLTRLAGYLPSLRNELESRSVEVMFRPYDARVREAGIVSDFLNCIGLGNMTADGPVERRNEAVGPVQIEAVRRLKADIEKNGTTLTRAQSLRCRKILKRAMRVTGLSERSYCGLTTDSARTIEATLQAEHDAFASSVWGKPWNEVFTGDVGRTYECNDLTKVAPSEEQQKALDELLAFARPRIQRALRRSA